MRMMRTSQVGWESRHRQALTSCGRRCNRTLRCAAATGPALAAGLLGGLFLGPTEGKARDDYAIAYRRVIVTKNNDDTLVTKNNISNRSLTPCSSSPVVLSHCCCSMFDSCDPFCGSFHLHLRPPRASRWASIRRRAAHSTARKASFDCNPPPPPQRFLVPRPQPLVPYPYPKP